MARLRDRRVAAPGVLILRRRLIAVAVVALFAMASAFAAGYALAGYHAMTGAEITVNCECEPPEIPRFDGDPARCL